MRRRLLALAALALAAAAAPTLAQDKPPLKILVGFPPGGSADVIARLVGDALRDDYAPVENRPGASGRIALMAVKFDVVSETAERRNCTTRARCASLPSPAASATRRCPRCQP